MAQSSAPEQPRHNGRMTPDEMEQAIRELKAWLAHVRSIAPELVPGGAAPPSLLRRTVADPPDEDVQHKE